MISSSGITSRADRRPRLALERLVLEDGLDDEVVAGERIGPDGRLDAGHDLVRGRPVELALLDLPSQVALDPLPALVGQLTGAIAERHALAGGCGHLGDPVSHQAGTHDVDALDAHRARSVPAVIGSPWNRAARSAAPRAAHRSFMAYGPPRRRGIPSSPGGRSVSLLGA